MIATASSVPVSTSRITFCAIDRSVLVTTEKEGAGGERAAAPGSHPGSSNRRALVLHARRPPWRRVDRTRIRAATTVRPARRLVYGSPPGGGHATHRGRLRHRTCRHTLRAPTPPAPS